MSFYVVFKCKNRCTKKNVEQLEVESALNRKISFHLFPKNLERRKKWLKALLLENYEPVKSAAICSAHFKNTDYEPNHTNRKLKKDAVPYLLETEIQPAIQIDLHHQNTIQENTTIEKNNNVADKNIETNMESDNIMSTHSCNINQIHRSTSISPDRIINSPIKTGIRKVYTNKIKTLKRRLSTSQYEQKKIQKKLLTLKNVLKDVQKRKLLTEEESESILQYLDASMHCLKVNKKKY
ncbi:THAP domain-containing protein 2-like [Camponotus floridanus]|uniref:THAP domain-containing protein 2-like n=1 Tax=Camponotus floridanus TaxID=104421 RepID=UPI000DC687A5|nr:THAP domain-containing protein 2-like [Camponotus floridanus]